LLRLILIALTLAGLCSPAWGFSLKFWKRSPEPAQTQTAPAEETKTTQPEEDQPSGPLPLDNWRLQRVEPAAYLGLRIGVGSLTEEVILGHLTALITERLGLEARISFGRDPQALRSDLLNNRLDLAWDYTGQALVVYQRNLDRDVLRDPKACFETVKSYDASLGLLWGRPAPANSTYGLLMRREELATAGQAAPKTISDLAAYARALKPPPAPAPILTPGTQPKTETTAQPSQAAPAWLGVEEDFNNRPDGYKALAALYGFKFEPKDVLKLKPEELFNGLVEGRFRAAVGPIIDSRIIPFELVALKEDKPFFPAYNPAPVFRLETALKHPALVKALEKAAARLDGAAMTRLVYLVELENQDPAKVVAEWIDSH